MFFSLNTRPLVPRVGFALLAICSSCCSSALAVDGPTHPIVPGFERFYAEGAADSSKSADGGLVLFGELGCANCHAPSDAAKLHLLPKQGPVLDAVASRVRPEYLQKFLADPQATKPGTTMPNVLAGWNEPERKEAVEALMHFLAFSGGMSEISPSPQWAKEGEQLYHRVGCVACHGSRRAEDLPLATSMPLGDLTAKYSVPALTQFLENPHNARPSGRMPSLNLNSDESRNLAHYLLRDFGGSTESNLSYRCYEGDWDKLPDFSKLQPAASGKCYGLDLSRATRSNNVGLVFDGFLSIKADGDYNFFLNSDDGSKLILDGKVVVNHDGIHGASEQTGSARLTRGMHTFRTEVFNGGGGFELRIDMDGGGGGRQSIEPFLYPTNQLPTQKPDGSKRFVADVALADKGRALFTNIGCANCHAMKFGGEQITSKLITKPEAELLPAATGCIGAKAERGVPQYKLSPPQTTAIVAAIDYLAKPLPAPTPTQVVNRTLTAFNCYTCHERDKIGGVEDTRNVFFETTTKEMGDEGRLPPSLTGAGAKLTKNWLNHLWDSGHKVRPYMLTRMPKYGPSNVGQLTDALEKLDKIEPVTAPEFSIAAAKVKSDGRLMVGAKGFGCIKCHDFNGAASTGVRAIDLANSIDRLKHDWFIRYMANPQVFRPGTRMPSAWPPTGKSYLANILDGDSVKQIEAVWLYFSDRDRAAFPTGLGRDPIELVADKEPVIYRNFIEGAGPRAIGVGYPEKVNLAFDANNMRLAMIWQGAFIDASKHWVDRGAGFQQPLGDNVIKFVDQPSFAVLASPEESWPAKKAKELGYQWRGYRLTKEGRPVFLYNYAGATIEDELQPAAGDPPALRRVITLKAAGPVTGLYYQAAKAGKIESLPDGVYKIDDSLTVRTTGGEKLAIRNNNELIMPVKFDGNTAQIVQEYLW